MQKRVGKSRRLNNNSRIKGIAFSEIFIMIIAIVAFAFVLAEAGVVMAGDVKIIEKYLKQGEDFYYGKGDNGKYYKLKSADNSILDDSITKSWYESLVKYLAYEKDIYFKQSNLGMNPPNPNPSPAATLTPGLVSPGVALLSGKYSFPEGVKEYTITGTKLELSGNNVLDVGDKILSEPTFDKGILKVDVMQGTIKKALELKDADATKFMNAFGSKFNKPAQYEGSILGHKVGGTIGGGLAGANSLLAGITTAGIAFGIGQTLGAIFGFDAKDTQTISKSLAAGAYVWEVAKSGAFLGKGSAAANFVSSYSGLIGLGVAVLTYLLSYKKEKTKTITFTCLPWQPQTKGDYCSQCNNIENRPCSEYRCKSLGQACELLNKEKPGEELCVWKAPNDAESPSISPWEEALLSNKQGIKLKYVSYVTPKTGNRPAERGVSIEQKTTKCIPAFTAIQFGLNVSEPSQCKIDYNHTNSFDEMEFYFGDSNSYSYYHKQQIKLPGVDANNTGLILQNDGTMQFFVRCRDANENYNVDEYSIKFCVDASPDTTPPSIDGTSLTSGSPVRFNVSRINMDVYVNEIADCKWSTQDKPFADMENTLDCAQSASEINSRLSYTCNTTLTGIKDNQINKYYFRCEDKAIIPNKMVQSYEFELKGSKLLNIIKVSPNETITGNTLDVKVNLEVETDDGAEEGKAWCYFSPTPFVDGETYPLMFETGSYLHKQEGLLLQNGTYNYYFKCTDLGGNTAYSQTSFNVFVDRETPIITRIYKEEGLLKLKTNEESECVYSISSCNYIFDDGPFNFEHINIKTDSYAKWNSGTTYYIKCKDKYENEPSNPNGCSAIVKPIETISSNSEE